MANGINSVVNIPDKNPGNSLYNARELASSRTPVLATKWIFKFDEIDDFTDSQLNGLIYNAQSADFALFNFDTFNFNIGGNFWHHLPESERLGDLRITFIEYGYESPNAGLVTKMIRSWYKSMRNKDNTFNLPSKFKKDGSLVLLGDNYEELVAFDLQGLFIKTIGDLNFEYDHQKALTFDITFSYDKVRIRPISLGGGSGEEEERISVQQAPAPTGQIPQQYTELEQPVNEVDPDVEYAGDGNTALSPVNSEDELYTGPENLPASGYPNAENGGVQVAPEDDWVPGDDATGGSYDYPDPIQYDVYNPPVPFYRRDQGNTFFTPHYLDPDGYIVNNPQDRPAPPPTQPERYAQSVPASVRGSGAEAAAREQVRQGGIVPPSSETNYTWEAVKDMASSLNPFNW